MIRSLTALAIMLCPVVSAQFRNLATNDDGSVVYFISTLRLKGSDQPLHEKIFVADAEGVRLFRSRPKIDVDPSSASPCRTGPYYQYLSVELSGDSRLIAAPMAPTAGGAGCAYLVEPATELTNLPGEPRQRGRRAAISDIPGELRLSANGHYAVVIKGKYLTGLSGVLKDLVNGTEAQILEPVLYWYGYSQRGRIVANDGTTLTLRDKRAAIVRPGAEPRLLPSESTGLGMSGFMITADASTIVYAEPVSEGSGSRWHVMELETLADRLLDPQSTGLTPVAISNDGSRVLSQFQGLWITETRSLVSRKILSDDPIVSGALSGDGRIVYASTRDGRLLKINLDSGVQTEIVARTPYLDLSPSLFEPGLAAQVTGGGFAAGFLEASVPLPTELGGIQILLGGKPLPMVDVTPTSVRFLTPWDTILDKTALTMRFDGAATPFEPPSPILSTSRYAVAGFPLYREDWTPLPGNYVGVGALIHILATGLGPTIPEVPLGSVAPLTEPLARLRSPLTCNDADVSFAGLKPGTVERIYQVDLRFKVAGYHKYFCTVTGTNLVLPLSVNGY